MDQIKSANKVRSMSRLAWKRVSSLVKEIGGYFGLELFLGKEYHQNLIPVNNGRNALLYIIKARNIRKLYLPYFLCDSITNLCEKHRIDTEYYHINERFEPLFNHKLGENEYLYIVNYYGFINNNKVHELKKKYNQIIVDNAQAFFQKPAGVDTIYSCRKFLGVPDGGYVFTDAPIKERIGEDLSKDRMRHILGRFEVSAADFYADFKANDHYHKQLPLRYMSKLTHNLLSAIDYAKVQATREANFLYLHEMLSKLNTLNITGVTGPYAYPLYIKNGMEIKKKLSEEKIYVATLWPNVLTMVDSIEKDYAKNILPLPCDQRYDKKDMERMYRSIMAYMEDYE